MTHKFVSMLLLRNQIVMMHCPIRQLLTLRDTQHIQLELE